VKNRLICTCPSRGRPKLLKQMLESFYKTKSPNTDIGIYIDKDEPLMSEYDDILFGKYPYYVLPRIPVAQAHNFIVNQNPNYDFYMPINDDITFITPGWDKILIDAINNKGEGWGISYPDDSTENWKHNLPTFGMMSGNIVKTIGHLYPLELKISFGDNFLLDIGRAMGRLFYCSNAVIRHTPPGICAQAYVPGDLRLNPALHKEEELAYARYIDNKLDSDLSKIFEAIINEKSLVGANK
jgi:hypothetical protein